jgi:uncharacterized repeat protein (TIGR03803 family)
VEPIWFLNQGTIAVGSDSNLYSTSPSGGDRLIGTIFRISPAGDVKVLFNFDRATGAGPQSGLINGGDGWFYGTTYSGGKLGVGTIFRIRPTDSEPQVLYNFRNGSVLGLKPPCPTCPYSGRQRADIAPSYPIVPPVRAANGTLYGVTTYTNAQGLGAMYSMAPPYDSTSFHTLCIFDQRLKADTAMARYVCKPSIYFPGTLILSRTGGELYGTTLSGNGAVFRATLDGSVTTIHEFDGPGGSKPYNVMQGSDGRLYGTTANGGDANLGTVFRLNPASGDFRVMSHLHQGSNILGLNPIGGLVEAVGDTDATSGAVHFLYGTTKFGGKYGRGILFRIPLDGDEKSFRVVHNFDMYTTGRTPVTPLVLGPKGLLYGVTYQGGTYDAGAFYTLNPIVLPTVTFHDAVMQGGLPAKNDEGFLINDPIVEVRTGVTASQAGGAVMPDGMMVRARCPNPHIIQFIYRERISPTGERLPGLWTPTGPYALTTDLADKKWHTDVPLKKDPALAGHYNAYLDQAPGAVHQSIPTAVTILDAPGFGDQGAYPPSGQNPDTTKSETWRATLYDFVFCNCQVTREVWWSREMRGGKVYYAHIRVFIPAPDILDWISSQLRKDDYAPVP